MKYEFIEAKEVDRDLMITLERRPNWLERLVGFREKRLTAYGFVSVWYWYPSHVRCSTSWEIFFERWARWHRFNSLPNNLDASVNTDHPRRK